MLLMPLGSTLLLITIGIFNKSFRLILIGLVILYSFSTKIVSEKLINYVEKDWEYLKPEIINNANSVVVLSGEIKKLSSKNNYYEEWNDPDRFFAGINILKSNKAKKIIFTGNRNPFLVNSKVEGELLKKEAISLGIAPENILITKKVLNTYQESLAVKDLILKNNLDSEVILVTSAFHMSRAVYIFEKLKIKVIPYPVDFKSGNLTNSELISNPINWLPEPKNLEISSLSLREILGRIYYFLDIYKIVKSF